MQQFSLHGQDPQQVKMGFGALLQEEHFKVKFIKIGELILTLACIGGGGYFVVNTFIFMGASAYVSRFFSHDYWVWAAIFIGGIIGFIRTALTLIREKDSQVERFEKGFYLKAGGIEFAYAYQDITNFRMQLTDHYYNGIKTGTTVETSMDTKDGQHFSFNLNIFPNAVPLAQALVADYERPRNEEIMEMFKKGKPISFGPLTLTTSGIETSDGMLPRVEFKRIETLYGGANMKLIDSNNKTFGKYAWKDIPNRGIFSVLILSQVPDIEIKN